MKMTDKLTPNTMKDQYDHQWNVFVRKNHDYGNSFEKSLDTFGLVAGIVRMNDKFERLVSLNDPNKDAQIASESLVDTLEDLSNYAAMVACWLKRKKERNWAKERLTAIKKEGVPVCKELEDAILKSVDDKIKAAEIYLNGHKAVYEFPDGIDTIASYLQQLSREEAKKENDRVMLDMMLSRIEKCWEEEVKLEGQNGSSVTFSDSNGIFSFGDGVIARSLGDITLTAEPCKPKEKKENLE